MLSNMLHMHPQVLSLSEFWTVFPTRDLPATSMTGEEFWGMMAWPNPYADGFEVAGLPFDEYYYPYDRARFDPATGVPSICRVLAALDDDPDALYDKLAGVVPSWPLRPASGHCRALFDELAAMFGRRLIVERTGGVLGKIPSLRRRFPDARFIFLHRDGPDCALSMMRHPAFRLESIRVLTDILSTPPLPENLPEEIRAMDPRDLKEMITPPFDGKRMQGLPIPLAFFGWQWSFYTRIGSRAIRDLWPDEWMTVRYERLLKDTRGELTRVASFIGAPAEGQWLDNACNFVDPRRAGTAVARLDQGELAMLQAVCETGRRAFDLLESDQAVSA